MGLRGRDVYGSPTRFGFELRRGHDEAVLRDLLLRVIPEALRAIGPDGVATQIPRLCPSIGQHQASSYSAADIVAWVDGPNGCRSGRHYANDSAGVLIV